jgi:hypothetical protein
VCAWQPCRALNPKIMAPCTALHYEVARPVHATRLYPYKKISLSCIKLLDEPQTTVVV